MTTNVLQAIAAELELAVDPLREILQDPYPPRELLTLLRDAGWTLPGLGGLGLDDFHAGLGDVIAAVEQLPGTIDVSDLAAVPETLVVIAEAVEAVSGLTILVESLVDDLVEELQLPSGTPGDLAADVFDELLARWMASSHPVAFSIARAAGLVAVVELPEVVDGSGRRVRGGTVPRLDLGSVPALLEDPVGFLAAFHSLDGGLSTSRDAELAVLLLAGRVRPLVGWLGGSLGTWSPWSPLGEMPAADHGRLRRTLALDLGLPTLAGGLDQTSMSLGVEVLGMTDRGQLGSTGPGVEFRPLGLVGLQTGRGGWSVSLEADAGSMIFVSADGSVEVADDGLTIAATMERSTGGIAIVGAAGGTRLELPSPEVTLGVGLDADTDTDFEVEVVLPQARLVVTTGDSDSFVASVLPDVDVDISFDLGLAWSRTRGLRLSSSNDLVLRLPLDIPILGLITVDVLVVEFDASGTSLALDLRFDGSFVLGPFSARIEGLGLQAAVDLGVDDGNIGIGDLSIVLLPPLAVEFEIALGDTINGGGFVRNDPDTGRWTGALDLQVLCIDLGAIVVVDTRLPGDPDGWALFASLFLTFPQVPLGFGFFLSGVGGIVCLHRTMDTYAIAAGLREGAVDTILFPDDPVADAPAIIAQLDAWFPIAPGATVIGIAAMITWGTPRTLLTGQLAIALVLPDVAVVVLGSIALVLPGEDDPILELHLDTLGAYDSGEQTLLVVASLYDSTLLGTIDLSGDMAMYSRFGSTPYFLFSVGGFHPEFRPPGDVPEAVVDLRRLRAEVSISDDVWYSLETYVAVTSNTFQFGAAATLEASAKFLGVTYTARGHIGFDVLLQFSPFAFVVSFTAGVAVTSGSSDKELLAVSLDARLEGPRPWFATGTASFKFLGIKVSFDVAVGGTAGVEARPRQHVLDLVVEALAAPNAWRAVVPDDGAVVLADAPPSGDDDPDSTPTDDVPLRVRPDGRLVVTQTVAPLDRRMDVYGTHAIDGPDMISIDDAGIVGVPAATWTAVTDWFAPALYDEMTHAQRLSAQSFEAMDAGVEVTAAGITSTGGDRVLTPDYEVAIIADDFASARRVGIRGQLASATAMSAESLMDPAVSGGANWTVSSPPPVTTTAGGWVLADATTGEAVTGAGTQRRARTQLARRQPDTTNRADLRVVPAHAVRTPA